MRTGDLSFREAHALIQFLLKLFHNPAQQVDAPAINQYSDKISHGPGDPLPANDRIEYGTLLLSADRRRFPHLAQFSARSLQLGYALYFAQCLVGIKLPAK